MKKESTMSDTLVSLRDIRFVLYDMLDDGPVAAVEFEQLCGGGNGKTIHLTNSMLRWQGLGGWKCSVFMS